MQATRIATQIRSILFLIWFLALSLMIFVAGIPLFLAPRRVVMSAAQMWARLMLFGLEWLCGLSYEVRGREHIPRGAALIASKHFTMWETIAFMVLVRDPAIVLKRELAWIPLYGWYARKMGMITIDRAGRDNAVRALRKAARRAFDAGRQIIVFPEGTRRKLGDPPLYRPGIAGLYAGLEVPCVPVAHNSGCYWIAGGFLKKPGRIVVTFLPPIAPGLARSAFMAELETRIEAATNRLLQS